MSESPENAPKQDCACCGDHDANGHGGGGPKSSRRDFLLLFGAGLNIVAGAMISLPLVGFAASTFLKRFDREWIDLGPISKFPVGAVRIASYRNPHPRPWDGQTADIPCWVRRIKEEEFQVFAINCTHLGCPVRWFEQSKLFLCPCHGGAFYEDGSHAAGPPPRELYQYPTKIENGSLWVKGGVLPNLANPGDTPAKPA